MPLCPQCARVSPNDANLCAYCGRPFSHSVSTGPTESKGCGYTVAVTWLALCVVALIFALTGMVKFPVSALPLLTLQTGKTYRTFVSLNRQAVFPKRAGLRVAKWGRYWNHWAMQPMVGV